MKLLTKKQLAEYLGCCPKQIDLLMVSGLPYINIGKGSQRQAPRYDPAAVMEWLEMRLSKIEILKVKDDEKGQNNE
jgi:phage terminase Nu1 subunit (DNA packaging protein)